MNARVIKHIVIMVVAVLVGSYLAQKLVTQQKDKFASQQAFSSSLAGFNKFASDIQWMLFINYSGSIKSVDKDNVDIVYKKLDTILKNDPSFEKAYEIGALMLSVEAPDKAVEILERGIANDRVRQNWKIPFYAGYVMTHHSPDKDTMEGLNKAEGFFKEALRRCGASEKHVFSQLMHTKARKMKLRPQYAGIKISNEKVAYVCAYHEEWKKQSKVSEFEMEMTSFSPDFKNLVLAQARSAKQNYPDDPDVNQAVELVKKDIFGSERICDACFSNYAAGDKYCSVCGATVTVYGTCPKCSATLKGKYCAECGADSQAEK